MKGTPVSSPNLASAKVRYIFVLIGVILAFAVVGVSTLFLNGIEQRLRADVEYYIKTITEQVAESLGRKIDSQRSSLKAFHLESTNPADIQEALVALQRAMGFPYVAFEGVDGVGFLADGTPFTHESFGVPDNNPTGDTLTGTTIICPNTGKTMRVLQRSLYLHGEKIGSLYAAVYPNEIISENELRRFSTTGYFVLLDSLDESIFLPLSVPTEELIERNPELRDFLVDTQVQGESGSGQTAESTSENSGTVSGFSSETVLYRSYVDGVPSYICIAPTSVTNWYFCSIIPENSLRADTLGIAVAFQTAFVAIMVCLIAVLFIAFLLYRRRRQDKYIETRMFLFEALTKSLDMAISLYYLKSAVILPIVAKSKKMLGYTFEEFMEVEGVAESIDTSEEGLALIDKIKTRSITSFEEGEFSIQDTKNNQTKWIFYSVNPVTLENEDQYLIVFRDMTTEKNLQLSMRDAMVAAEMANKAKSEFLSRMSHEIRTPMNAIIGMTAIALKNLDNKKKVKDSLERITTASEHLLNITNEFLDISKIESGKIAVAHEPFNLIELVNDVAAVINMQSEQKNQRFTLVIGDITSEVLIGDRVRLQQVLFNLLTNAVKYTPEKGSILFEVHEEPSVVDRYMSVVFLIADDGIGMTKEFQEHLFEPFTMEERSSEGGTGLGLAIVKNIVTMFNGDIQVESEPDQGTTWCVILNLERYGKTGESSQKTQTPKEVQEADRRQTFGSGTIRARVAQEGIRGRFSKAFDDAVAVEDDSSREKDRASERSVEGLRILLVEDNELNADIARELLEEKGTIVDWAHDGQQGCDMFGASEPGYYDVILMDIQMPLMGGYEATRVIRSLDRADAHTVPIIAMSANAFKEDIRASYENGMDDHLSKPINVNQIIESILKHL